MSKIEIVCPGCNGSKVDQGRSGTTEDFYATTECKVCGGTGLINWGQSEGIPTYKILEVTDSDEYMALDANKKHWYDLFISAGVLDMSDGSKARDLFLAWIFPPGKKTYAALMAIL